MATALYAPVSGNIARDLAQLAELDQFHTGGMEATIELAERAALTAGVRVLDVGGGLGGPARVLTHTFGCQVMVVDVTEAYCRAGEQITAWIGLADRAQFKHGDALALPFSDSSFDLAWTQHSSMNIANKPRLYTEIHRVLRPGGRLALFEVAAGPGDAPHYPAFWARSPATSFLLTPEVLRTVLAEVGFREFDWQDRSDWALSWLVERQRVLENSAPPSGLPRILGPAFRSMAHNHLWNLQEGRIRIIAGVLVRE